MSDSKDEKLFELTAREGEVLALLIRGWKQRKIADYLCISPSTVKCHTINILRKLEAVNMVQAVSVAYERGILYLACERGKTLQTVDSN